MNALVGAERFEINKDGLNLDRRVSHAVNDYEEALRGEWMELYRKTFGVVYNGCKLSLRRSL